MIPTLPYLAPWYRIAAGENKVVLEYGQRVISLGGRAAVRLLPALLPLLDGTRSVDEIVRVLGEPVRPAVVQALGQLAEHDLLLEGPSTANELAVGAEGTVHLLSSIRSDTPALGETLAALSRRAVAIAGEAPVGVELAALLRRSGVTVDRSEEIGADRDLTICAPAPAELPRLRAWNEQALTATQPWLQILPFDGRYGAIGPLYLPGDTCCYECFRLRRASNLNAPAELSLLEASPAPYPVAPFVDAAIAGLATLLALQWLVLADHYAPAAFYSLELAPVIGLSVHHVHRVPRCPVCSELAGAAPPLPWHKEIPVAGS
jgi:bacteriocin biosynthesis cyclodehydratase domain-containing protein